MQERIRKRAFQAIQEILAEIGSPHPLPHIRVLPNAAVALFFRVFFDDDPINLLKRNADAHIGAMPAPTVIDPQTGSAAMRCVIPYKAWANKNKLKSLFTEPDHSADPISTDRSNLRLILNIPNEVRGEYIYGNSGRVALLLDHRPVLLAVNIFNGITESPVSLQAAIQASWILLARSGVSNESFHALRTTKFTLVERIAEVQENIGQPGFKALETSLLRSAEEERRILESIFTDHNLSGNLSEICRPRGVS